jgi:hypothetical protein
MEAVVLRGHTTISYLLYDSPGLGLTAGYLPEVGTRNFFLSSQSQFRNLKEALPQSQFRNFFRNVAPQPQLRNSAIAIFSEVRNLRLSLPQFLAYFWLWSSLKLDIFLPPGFFCYREDFKGTKARDFRRLFFCESTHMNCSRS